MELLGNHLHVFISLVLILSAALVALICDLLKRNNEHLRELNVELRVRREEEQRRVQLLTQSAAPLSAATPAGLIAPRPESMDASLQRVPVAVAQPAMDRAAEIASRRGSRRSTPPVETTQDSELKPGASLAEARMLAREFMGRAAARAGHSAEPVHAAPRPDELRQPEVLVEQTAPPRRAASSNPSPRSAGRKNWDLLLSNTKKSAVPATVEIVPEKRDTPAQKPRLGELIPFETIQSQSDELTIPAGFHEGMVLARILNGGKSIRGLVVVIGINDLSARRESAELGAEALVAGVTDHIRSMIAPGEFACQKSQDEFIMICPGLEEPAVQRRLAEIAEALWDYQLRSVGTSAILFSWGGLEAKGDPFADVLAAASERMQETRRSRRSLSINVPFRRKAV